MNNVAPFIKPQPDLDALVNRWLECKASEQQAIALRREVEEMIVELMPHKDEGSVSEVIGANKVTATFKLTRTIDAEAVKSAWNDLPELIHDAFSWKPELVTKQMRALESANPAAYATLARFITTSQAKPSLKVEPMKGAA